MAVTDPKSVHVGTVARGDEESPAITERPSKALKFPTPKHVLTISAPLVHIVQQEKTKEKTDAWSGFMSPAPTEASVQRVKIKMAALIVKMLNQLVQQKVIAFDRVVLNFTPTTISVRILAGDSTIPILLMRCERLGIGSIVGFVFVTPVEFSLVPEPPQEIEQRIFEMPKSINNDIEIQFPAPSVHEEKVVANEEEQETDIISISSEEGDHAADGYNEGKNVEEDIPTAKILSETTGLSIRAKKNLIAQVKDARQEWIETAGRVRVAQVLEEVNTNAQMTFDYVCYCVIAAWIAALGLMTDSTTVVIASMLVSPLMGPCLAATFGTNMKQFDLVLIALRNELMSLVICVLIGMLSALIALPSRIESYGQWPSAEMTGRGTVNNLVVGALIALPSGFAVALSTLGSNSGGLTGVAISLSLLPPAVNAGLCWMTSALLHGGIGERNDLDDTNYALTGTLSFCLTLLNIFCIWLGGCTMFYIKEVAPIPNKNTFWERDVKLARSGLSSRPDASVIGRGIAAALELRNNEARNGMLHKQKGERDIRGDDRAEARRRSLADNAIEDALYMGNHYLRGQVVPGGAGYDELIPDEVVYVDTAVSDIDSEKQHLLDKAEMIGGLKDAGEFLFVYDFGSESLDDIRDVGIVHQDAAGQLLF